MYKSVLALSLALPMLWDEDNEDQCGLIIQDPDLSDLLTKSVPELRAVLRLRDMWAHLCSMRVIASQDRESIQVTMTQWS